MKLWVIERAVAIETQTNRLKSLQTVNYPWKRSLSLAMKTFEIIGAEIAWKFPFPLVEAKHQQKITFRGSCRMFLKHFSAKRRWVMTGMQILWRHFFESSLNVRQDSFKKASLCKTKRCKRGNMRFFMVLVVNLERAGDKKRNSSKITQNWWLKFYLFQTAVDKSWNIEQ